jgi:hypothetical protein
MFYPLTAFLTLFANILQNPKGSYVEADSRLMNIIADFFFISMTDYDDTPLERQNIVSKTCDKTGL